MGLSYTFGIPPPRGDTGPKTSEMGADPTCMISASGTFARLIAAP
jgi:hypothetical protein